MIIQWLNFQQIRISIQTDTSTNLSMLFTKCAKGDLTGRHQLHYGQNMDPLGSLSLVSQWHFMTRETGFWTVTNTDRLSNPLGVIADDTSVYYSTDTLAVISHIFWSKRIHLDWRVRNRTINTCSVGGHRRPMHYSAWSVKECCKKQKVQQTMIIANIYLY